MVEVQDNRDRDRISKAAEHRAKDGERRVGAAARPGLQDHRLALGLGRHGEGAGVLPAKADKPGHGVSVAEGRLQDLGKRGAGHLNLATMSMMPGMVCNWSAWVG
jgi:hypothetical protein